MCRSCVARRRAPRADHPAYARTEYDRVTAEHGAEITDEAFASRLSARVRRGPPRDPTPRESHAAPQAATRRTLKADFEAVPTPSRRAGALTRREFEASYLVQKDRVVSREVARTRLGYDASSRHARSTCRRTPAHELRTGPPVETVIVRVTDRRLPLSDRPASRIDYRTTDHPLTALVRHTHRSNHAMPRFRACRYTRLPSPTQLQEHARCCRLFLSSSCRSW